MDKFSSPLGTGRRAVFVVLLVLAAVIGLWLWWGLYGITLFASRHSDELTKLGQAGDLFGGVNALFAAFAFAGVAVAAYYQYLTNGLQKQALTIAAFEPLFFHLLELHGNAYRDLVLGVHALVGGSASADHADSKRTAHLLRKIESQSGILAAKTSPNAAPLAPSDFNQILQRFDEVYIANEDQLGPYYRALYHVFNLIDSSGLEASEKVRYANIARSTLDKDELLLLMMNCAHPRGQRFKGLMEKYGLLKHISTDSKNNALDVALATTMFHPNARKSSEERKAADSSTTTQDAWWRR